MNSFVWITIVIISSLAIDTFNWWIYFTHLSYSGLFLQFAVISLHCLFTIVVIVTNMFHYSFPFLDSYNSLYSLLVL